jgi:hypothetical protein
MSEPKSKPMPYATTVLPSPNDAPLYTVHELLVENEFAKKVALRNTLTAAQDKIEKELRDLNWDITSLMLALGMESGDKVQVPDCGDVVLIQGSTASKLSESKLVEKGVDPDVIMACKEPGTQYWYVQVKKGGKTTK